MQTLELEQNEKTSIAWEQLEMGREMKEGIATFYFAEEHKLILADTLLQKPKDRFWTWESPDGETRN